MSRGCVECRGKVLGIKVLAFADVRYLKFWKCELSMFSYEGVNDLLLSTFGEKNHKWLLFIL